MISTWFGLSSKRILGNVETRNLENVNTSQPSCRYTIGLYKNCHLFVTRLLSEPIIDYHWVPTNQLPWFSKIFFGNTQSKICDTWYIFIPRTTNYNINSLAPGRFEFYNGWNITCEIALRWLSLDHTDNKLTLVQVMAWCRQATSHCVSQCWLSFLPPYDVTRP